MVLRVEDLTRREDLEVLVSAVAHLGKSFIDASVEPRVAVRLSIYSYVYVY